MIRAALTMTACHSLSMAWRAMPRLPLILDERNGALMWPERFGAKEVAAIKAGLGPYMASGRLQQSPQPKGGGIFKSEWWQVWEGTHFPIIDLVIASSIALSRKSKRTIPRR